MRYSIRALVAAITLGVTSGAFAVPTLQLGAPAAAGDSGIYADYQASTSNPTESDTAITFGTTVYLAGAYGPKTQALGGKYGGGSDWSDFGRPAAFNGHGAILVVSVPEGQSGTLKINLGSGWVDPFYTSLTESYFPNNHAPVKDGISDFMFFDVGSFNNLGSVPDFASESGSAAGEIKTMLLDRGGYDWIHFDMMALETSSSIKKGKKGEPDTITWTTSLQFNPGSHDVTDPPLPTDIVTDSSATPEPATAALSVIGVVGALFASRRRR